MDNIKPFCFVIQEFDEGGTFDKRYKETIMPALIEAGVEPKRGDEILGLQPIIDKIEVAIEQVDICVAEVSNDNPNVWLELGYALALDRPVVILCDKQLRQRLPFDIQHRPVIYYRTNSKSGYEELEESIIKHVKNELKREQDIKVSPKKIVKNGSIEIENIKDYEIVILLILLALWPTSHKGAAHWEVERKFRSSGHGDAELALGLSDLLEKGFITRNVDEDFNGNEFLFYQITPDGIGWVKEREGQLDLSLKFSSSMLPPPDDDIPF